MTGWARGDDVRIVFAFPEDIDITGMQILFTVKRAPDDDPDDSTALVAVDAAITDAHTAEVVLSSAESDLPPRQYAWDLKIVDADGRSTHTSVGQLTVRPVVTNRVP